jgi:GAF domain-containing protein
MRNNDLGLPAINADVILAFQATFLDYASLHEAATAYATELAVKLGFSRVSIGLGHPNAMRILAVSHENAESQVLQEALLLGVMEECATQNSTINFPAREGDAPKIILAHAAMHQQTGNQVLSVPLAHQSQLIGVMVFEYARSNHMTDDDISACEHATALFAPLLHLKSKAEQPILKRVSQRLKSIWTHDLSEHAYKRYALLGLLAFVMGLLFVPIQHRVGAPARLEGLVQRALVAPEDGFLQQTYVKPGDKIKSNQLLATLAEEDLILEQQKKHSELAQYENAYGAALAGSDRVQMMINQAKMEEINHQLALITQRIERSKIRAPFDGVVIEGDLKQLLGTPVQKGDALLTVAPSGAYRLIAEVDERDIDLIAVGQTGLLALVSMPDKRVGLRSNQLCQWPVAKMGAIFLRSKAR